MNPSNLVTPQIQQNNNQQQQNPIPLIFPYQISGENVVITPQCARTLSDHFQFLQYLMNIISTHTHNPKGESFNIVLKLRTANGKYVSQLTLHSPRNPWNVLGDIATIPNVAGTGYTVTITVSIMKRRTRTQMDM